MPSGGIAVVKICRAPPRGRPPPHDGCRTRAGNTHGGENKVTHGGSVRIPWPPAVNARQPAPPSPARRNGSPVGGYTMSKIACLSQLEGRLTIGTKKEHVNMNRAFRLMHDVQ